MVTEMNTFGVPQDSEGIPDPPAPSTPDVDYSRITPQFCLEMAAGLKSPDAILEAYGISDEDWKLIRKHPQYTKLYNEAKEYWHADNNTAERVKAVSGMMVEESLEAVYNIVHNHNHKPVERLDAFKTLAKMSATDGTAVRGDGNANRFVVNINLGDEEKNVVIDAVPLEGDEGDA